MAEKRGVALNSISGFPEVVASQLAEVWITTAEELVGATGLPGGVGALAGEKPVAFAVPVFRYWLTQPGRGSGDIRMPLPSDEKLGGHAMCLVGYEDDPEVPGGGYFLVRNSWGTDWARDSLVEAGYARLPCAFLAGYGRSAYTATAPEPEPEPEPEPNPADDDFLGWLRRLWESIFGA